MIESDYLCECGKLIYIDRNNNKEYCLDSTCKNFKDIKRIFSKTEEVEKEVELILNKLKISAFKFTPAFKHYLFRIQNELFEKLFFTGEGVFIDDFLFLNYLIFLVKKIEFRGRIKDVKKFDKFIEEIFVKIRTNFFYQDIKENNYILVSIGSEQSIPLHLKYFEAINEQKNEYGLVNIRNLKDAFNYEKLDLEKIERKELTPQIKFEEYFQYFFREMIKMELFTNTNYELSLIFKREKINKYNLGGLLSLFYSSKTMSGMNIISKKEIRKILSQMELSESQIKDFFIFLLGDISQISFVIDEGDKIYYGASTIFSMILKFLGTMPGLSLTNKGKCSAGYTFEEKIKDFFRDEAYFLPELPDNKLFKKSLEYDLIAIDEQNKKIYLGEAKYHDLPTSAFSSKNLIRIKLEDEEKGEKNICRRQLERKEELITNLDKLNEFCKKQGKSFDFSKFEIETFVITKFTPLVKRFEGVKLIGFKKLGENFSTPL